MAKRFHSTGRASSTARRAVPEVEQLYDKVKIGTPVFWQ
jgi:hypothetical protein